MGKKIHPKPPKQTKAKPKPQAPKQQQQQSSTSASGSGAEVAAAAAALPLPLQQRLLSTFTDTFGPVLNSDSLPALLQEFKAALYARDFDAAFARARPESLDAYAARWSPTRALGYAAVLLGVGEHLEELQFKVTSTPDVAAAAEDGKGDEDDVDEASGKDGEASLVSAPPAQKSIKMLSVGGGAAEIVAFAAYLSQQDHAVSGDITLLDSAPWGPMVTKLHDALTNPPPLSKYASAAAKASNAALVPSSHLSSTFTQQDVLALSRDELTRTLGEEALLVTLLFTLNELYTSAGIGKTTAFLMNLGAVVPHGSLLLVVDSPGSYSEAAVGKESKKYPMQWLLDHTLVKDDDDEPDKGCCRWERLESHDSVWFRLDESLHYPIALENMRYQMHLYRATRP